MKVSGGRTSAETDFRHERPDVSEIRPVRPNASLVDRNLGLVLRLVAIAVFVAIAKPWAWFGTSGAVTSTPTIVAVTTPPVTDAPTLVYDDLAYNPAIFGDHEPAAAWGLWPAAYLVTYGFIFQPADPGAIPFAVPSPAASPRGTRAPIATPGPSPTPPSDGGPAWPSRFDVPAGYHLFLIGIDMPFPYTLEQVDVDRLNPSGEATSVAIVQPTSPWPNHFAVIGIPSPANALHVSVWTPGNYRLSMVFGPGTTIQRTLEINVLAPPVPAPTRTTSG